MPKRRLRLIPERPVDKVCMSLIMRHSYDEILKLRDLSTKFKRKDREFVIYRRALVKAVFSYDEIIKTLGHEP